MKNMEMKIYELLGIKKFRKMVMNLMDKIGYIIDPKSSKEERQKTRRTIRSNYTIGTIHSLEDIKNFKKFLIFNTLIHTLAIIFLLPSIITLTTPINMAFELLLLTVNVYCIMLQRYNSLKIDQLIPKMQPKYEKKKKELIENVKTLDNKIAKHKYILVRKKKEFDNITFDEIIDKASYKELLIYKDYLKSLSDCEDNNISYEECIIPLSRNKGLILKK